MEFKHTINPFGEVPIMLLNDEIGFDPELNCGINGAQFQSELMYLDSLSPKSIDIWINSPGGNVSDGYNIYGTILKCKTSVDTHCLGMAASIAGVIFLAGRNRVMADYSWLMFHNPHGGDNKRLLDIMKGSIAKMVGRSGKTEDEILAMMKKETYIYADEAKEYGLCDRVEVSNQMNKKRLSTFTAEPTAFHREANLILNKIIEVTPKNSKMIKVANKLGLNQDASEDSILTAISEIENKNKKTSEDFEKKIKDLQDKMDSDKQEMEKLIKEKNGLMEAKNKLEKEVEDVTAEKDALQKEKEDAEMEALHEKCKNMVTAYAKQGRIKDDAKTIDFWTELAKADGGFDIVKDQIEAIPMNKKAPVVNIEKEGTKGKYTMGAAMVSIANKLETQNNK